MAKYFVGAPPVAAILIARGMERYFEAKTGYILDADTPHGALDRVLAYRDGEEWALGLQIRVSGFDQQPETPPTAPRKPVQIAVDAGEWGPAVFALCDDGTIWRAAQQDGPTFPDWLRLPAIPQDAAKNPIDEQMLSALHTAHRFVTEERENRESAGGGTTDYVTEVKDVEDVIASAIKKAEGR